MKITSLKIGLMLLILGSCADNSKNVNVSIETQNDTIRLDEIFTANLCVPHIDTIFPKFSIIMDSDTFLIPYEGKLGCAIFRAVGRDKGENVYNGEVEYVNKNGDQINERFKINFIVE